MIPTPGEILNAVSRVCGVTRFDLCGRRRWPKFVWARRVAVVALRAHHFSLKHIGEILDRDHSSILHLFQTSDESIHSAAREALNGKA